MLIDSHCHLNFPDFKGDLDAMMKRADDNGVGMMVSISTRMDEADDIAFIAKTYPKVVYSIGVHPLEASAHPDLTTDQLIDRAQAQKVVGLGETGLDFFRHRDDEDIQKKAFRMHIEAARALDLPIIIHSRAADKEMAELLEQEMAKAPFKAVMHCFTASMELAQRVLDLGLYISFSGILTFKNAQDLRQIARHIPLDRLLVETDAPYLAPHPFRGKRNEPAFVRHTALALADCQKTSLDELIKHSGDNFFRLFTRAQHYQSD